MFLKVSDSCVVNPDYVVAVYFGKEGRLLVEDCKDNETYVVQTPYQAAWLELTGLTRS